MIHAKEQKRVLLDDGDIDWVFTERETNVFRAMWESDMSMDSITEELGRKKLEIGLQIIEQAELGGIQVRQQGIFPDRVVPGLGLMAMDLTEFTITLMM